MIGEAWYQSYLAGIGALHGNSAFNQWLAQAPDIVGQAIAGMRHGKLDDWCALLGQLPEWSNCECETGSPAITVRSEAVLSQAQQDSLTNQLKQLAPWRKGPFDINGIVIDSEWRSDLKWERLAAHIAPLQDRLVLDVGCGNGYHCWRMAAAGARAVIGLDPVLLYLMQYFAIQHFVQAPNVFVLPLRLEALPSGVQAFDTVFSMGVLYHQRSPLQHLSDLRACLQPGGELVLETLVIEGDMQQLLVPKDRYARMKNVWFIPSVAMLEIWLQRTGFQNIRLLNKTITSSEEQRATAWSGTASLVDFLDPNNNSKTIEGYPAPCRAILLATA